MARTHAFVASILNVVQLSEDLKLVLEGQIEPNLSSSVNHEQAALNSKLIEDCEHMAREIEMLEAELEEQKSRKEESRPGTASGVPTFRTPSTTLTPITIGLFALKHASLTIYRNYNTTN